jgi:hypothetical protein
MTDQYDRETGELRAGEIVPVEHPATVVPPPQPLSPLPIGPVNKINKAVAAITQEAPAVVKGGHNAFHNFDYSRIDDYADVVGPLIGKYNIGIYETQVARGEIGVMAYIDYHFFISVDDQRIGPLMFTGMARSRDSKGNMDPATFRKCLADARKQFYTAQFHLKSEDDPEDDKHPPAKPRERPPIQQPKPAAQAPAQQAGGVQIDEAKMETWGNTFLASVRLAADLEALEKLVLEASAPLNRVRDLKPDFHKKVMTRVQARRVELVPNDDTPEARP